MLYDPSSPSFYFWPLLANISEHHSNKTVRVNQQRRTAVNVSVLMYGRGRRGLGNVVVLIVVWGRQVEKVPVLHIRGRNDMGGEK